MTPKAFEKYRAQVQAKYPRIKFVDDARQHKRAWAAVALILATHDSFIKHLNGDSSKEWKERWNKLRKWTEECKAQIQKRRISSAAMRELDSMIDEINTSLGDMRKHDKNKMWNRWMCLIKICATCCRDACYSAPLYTRNNDGGFLRHWHNMLLVMQHIDNDVDKMDGEEAHYDEYWGIYERVYNKFLAS